MLLFNKQYNKPVYLFHLIIKVRGSKKRVNLLKAITVLSSFLTSLFITQIGESHEKNLFFSTRY